MVTIYSRNKVSECITCILTIAAHAKYFLHGSRRWEQGEQGWQSASATGSGYYTDVLALYAGGDVKWGLERPTTFALRMLAPHSQLHAIVCMCLALCSGFGILIGRHPHHSRVYQLSMSSALLWWAFGLPGAFFCVAIFHGVEEYVWTARRDLSSSPLSARRRVRLTAVRRRGRTVLQHLERFLHKLLQGKLLARA